MGKRPHKASHLKLVEGNRGKRPIGQDEARPAPVTPGRPSMLDPEAVRMWDRLAVHLTRVGLLTDIDGDMFAGLCILRSRLIFLGKKLRTRDIQSLLSERTTEAGTVVFPHPYTVMERQYFQIFRMYAREFGLSPLARTGLSVGTEERDEGEDLLS